MEYCREVYGREYAPNTRETFRRQTMHQFVEAGIARYNPDDPARPVNSPHACYQISEEIFEVLKTYGTNTWESALSEYLEQHQPLSIKWAMHREMQQIPVHLPGNRQIELSPGAHSELIREILEQFAPRFTPGSEVIYIGDTGSKEGYFDRARLEELGVNVDRHGKMPMWFCILRDESGSS